MERSRVVSLVIKGKRRESYVSRITETWFVVLLYYSQFYRLVWQWWVVHNSRENSLCAYITFKYNIENEDGESSGVERKQKISTSTLFQVYMSKRSGLDSEKDLERKYNTTETLYKTCIRESNNVVEFPTRQMCETTDIYPVTDEIRRWWRQPVIMYWNWISMIEYIIRMNA